MKTKNNLPGFPYGSSKPFEGKKYAEIADYREQENNSVIMQRLRLPSIMGSSSLLFSVNKGCVGACALACSMACIGACMWNPFSSTCNSCADKCMDYCTTNC